MKGKGKPRGKGDEPRDDRDFYRPAAQQWNERTEAFNVWGGNAKGAKGGKDGGQRGDRGDYPREDDWRGPADDPWGMFESLLDGFLRGGRHREDRGDGGRGDPDPLAVSEWFELLKGKASGKGSARAPPRDDWAPPRDDWEGQHSYPPEKPREGKGKGKSKSLPSSGEVEECKIFVGGLPMDATEEMIEAHFKSWGDVQDVILKRKMGESQKSRGFGFVTFYDAQAARAVVENYDHNMFEGKWIDCKFAVADEKGKGGGKGKGKKGEDGSTKRPADDAATVIADGIPDSLLQEDLTQFFEFYGAVKEVQLDGGSAHVTFASPETAQMVLSNTEPVEIHGTSVALRAPADGAGQRKSRRQNGPTTDKVFVMNVPEDQTEEKMANYYGQFGTVKELHLPFDMDTAKIRGFCFITFETAEAAEKAVWNNTIGDCRLDYGQKRGGKAAEEASSPTDVFLKVSGLPQDPKQRDIFKLFFNYSLARIRDLDLEAIVEFCSAGECLKAFKEKQGGRMGKERVILSGATREDFVAMKAAQEAIGIIGRGNK